MKKIILFVAIFAVSLPLLFDDTKAVFPGINGKIVFHAQDASFNRDIYTINSDGTGLTRLTTDSASETFPAWSPDGTKIAYTRQGDFTDLYIMNADGSNQVKITSDIHVNPPDWSPDGTKIVFHAQDASFNRDIYTINSDGTGLTRLTTDSASETFPAWSPDGTQIAYERQGVSSVDLYIMNADGSNQINITNGIININPPSWQSLHGNTPAGMNILVGPLNGVTLNFSQVTQEGQTTVTTSGTGSAPPTGFKLGTPPTYYSISTTAAFNPPVEECISWTEGQFNNENNLKLWHFENGAWINITESGYPDTINNIICGLADSFSDFAIFEKKQVAVSIDIKPGSYPNSINLGSGGTVPVAIFSTPTFDATTVDPLTVTLASAPVQLRGNGTSMSSTQDVNSDGLLDIVVHVNTEALQLSSADQTANLIGSTFDNTEVVGSDTVRIVQ